MSDKTTNMSIQIYNTLSRQKEPFETIEPGRVRMYVCGPTVYSKAHIGHAMSVMIFDIIRRYLEYRGYQVRHVMNYTDVDDKIIQRASQEGINPFSLAERYTNEFDRHLEELNILPPSVKPRATRTIKQILDMIQQLVEKDYAYAINGDVYFRIKKDKDYGKLSRRKLEEMQSGFRIEVDVRKEHPMDFALWKSAKADEPSWESPWGMGRPGWHIECSAMSLTHLGEQIDIHGGGNDLIFPHHENEIAQTESLTGKQFARYWVHNGMLQLAGEKMSKSLGNLITIEEFLMKNSADVFRLMILNSSYRNPLTYSEEVINQTRRAIERMRLALAPALPNSQPSQEAASTLHDKAENTRKAFVEAMDDDFNSAGALGFIFDLVRSINQTRDSGADDATLTEAQGVLRELTSVLGLRLDPSEQKAGQDTKDIGPFIDLLIEIRNELRQQKLWALSDRVRDGLKEMGVLLEDKKDGTTGWRIE